MKYIVLLVIICSCKSPKSKIINITPFVVIAEKPTTLPNYDITKANITLVKKNLQVKYLQQKISLKEVEQSFTSVLVDSIFPHWYGTVWDFNGITQQPGSGSIACGYFITTTLQDAGVKLQRVKLAQCASQKIINTLITKSAKKTFSNTPLKTFTDYIRQQGKGVYIVGLDFHVGFIYNDGSDVYFIHSKWANPKAVVKEQADASGVLASSKYKIVGKLSSDELFLKNWLLAN